MDNLNEISFTSRYWVLLLPLALMAADVITGWLQATINGTWDSTKMRKGLFRKSAELLVIVVAYVVYVAISLPVDVPGFIAGYIIVMEILSVCENLDQAGVPMPTWLTRRLGKIAKDLTENDPFDKNQRGGGGNESL
jgi:toxin secretion/phage lysis holin